MKVIFMGTPYFAVPALEKLIASSKHEVIAVYTRAPKPAGRGYSETRSAVHSLADQHGIQVYTPKTLRDQHEQQRFFELKADVAIVAAYGLILPKEILNTPKHGCLNIHPSMLPRWRGAAPIQHTVLAGDRETSICIMQMDEGLDTGDIIIQQKLVLPDDIKAYELHDKAAQIGADLVIKALSDIESNNIKRYKQSEEGVTYAHKLTRDHEKIDWSKSAFEIGCQIRTFAPRPAAFFTHNGETIKIIEAEVVPNVKGSPGQVMDDDLTIACGVDAIKPNLLQREGKKMLYREAFLRGFELRAGVVLQ